MRENPLSPDRPISGLAEDQLGRRGFACSIAKVISQWRGRDSLVLAVYGQWGSGKSSLKNMIIDALSSNQATTLKVEFDPWQWAGQDKLFEGFFRELSARLGARDAGTNAASTALKMRMYGAMLSAASSLTDGFRIALIALLATVGFFGVAPTLTENSSFRAAVAVLGVLAIIAASVLAFIGASADKIAGYLAAKADAAHRTTSEVKKDLQLALRALKQNILVVIDDLDRLTPEQIRMMCQLVKANADFPNVVYLLLFQRDTIESALSSEPGVDGPAFLNKIVQVGFDVPKISVKQLNNEIQATISRTVEGTPASQRFASDSKRWNKLFPALIRYFSTLRDIKTFGNGLSFHLELHTNADTFDASPVDVVALEIIRQFEPTLYAKLYAAKPLLVPPAGLSFDSPAENQKDVEALLAMARDPESARILVSDLFPPAAWSLAGLKERERGQQADWLRDLRPCHADIFDRYFRFCLSSDDLPTSELKAVLAATSDRARLVDKLSELNTKNLLGTAIVLLRAHADLIDSDSIVPLATGLMDVEKELLSQPQQPGGPVEMQALWIIEAVLLKHPVGERGSIMREVISNTSALYLPLLSFEPSTEERRKAKNPPLSDKDAEHLKVLCLQKIRQAAATARFSLHPRLRFILGYWLRWGPVEEAPRWVSAMMASDVGLIRLLTTFSESMTEIDKNGTHIATQYRFALEEFSRFSEPDAIADRVRNLTTSLHGSDKIASQLFIQAFDHWKSTGSHISAYYPDEWTTLQDN